MGDEPHRVCPFGNPRVKEYVPLTVAYRSLSRPSSASCAKASTVCPYHLLSTDIIGDGLDNTLEHYCSMRSDAIFLKENLVKHAMQLSRYNEANPRNRTLQSKVKRENDMRE
ncbi:unnamed protein product [Cylicostephanus goldi]|uniref:Uncharacterized protein n=1 Tax=Cylicostephanus goldi TaxID=71465 RepID=A0A3P6S1M2_CYLGO|nr:unnamed protein product [Cylicostephanus goldi]